MTTRVVVGIPTRGRPAQLARLLAAVREQRVEGADVSVLVVDNDPAGSAREVAGDVGYVHEPAPGLARVRNRIVAEAGDADALVLLDDDELPRPGWLQALLRAQQLSGADAVGGPVLADLPPDAPNWLRTGRFLDVPRTRPADGARVDELGCGNVLLTRAFLDAVGPEPFDERFARTGGEDSVLFRAAHRRGLALVWADDAVVVEDVPAERVRLRWVLRRAFREGSIVWRRSRLLHERPAAVDLLRAAAVVGQGLLQLLLSPFRGSAVAGLHRSADGLGRLAAAVRVVPEPYR